MLHHDIRRRMIAEAWRERTRRDFWRMIYWVLAGFVGAFIIWLAYNAHN